MPSYFGNQVGLFVWVYNIAHFYNFDVSSVDFPFAVINNLAFKLTYRLPSHLFAIFRKSAAGKLNFNPSPNTHPTDFLLITSGASIKIFHSVMDLNFWIRLPICERIPLTDSISGGFNKYFNVSAVKSTFV